MDAPEDDVTELLARWCQGDDTALDRLTPRVYGELRRLARRRLGRERRGHTLQPTALVHEAFLRLVGQRSVSFRNRAHFYAIAARMMRRVLVDYARGRRARKRGSGAVLLSFDERMGKSGSVDLIGLDDALTALTALDPRQGRIVELRYFGGHSIEETADVLDISVATVKREWATARIWLRRELVRSGEERSEPKLRPNARNTV